jgi:hypothetical protein
MSDKGLLEIAHRLIVDREFRERFLIAPQDMLVDLGVSAEAYRALVAVVPILLAGGIGLIDSGLADKGINGPNVGWGRGG